MAFQAVAERDEDETVVSHPSRRPAAEEASAALQLLMTSLGALSKRTVIALAQLFTLATVGSAFWLWCATPEPTVLQLVSLGMYSAFVLAINFIVRRA